MSYINVNNKTLTSDRASSGIVINSNSILWTTNFTNGQYIKRSGSYLSSSDIGLENTQIVADESARLALTSATTVIQSDNHHVYLSVPGISMATTYGWIDLGALS